MLAISIGAARPKDAIRYLSGSVELSDAERLWDAAHALKRELSQKELTQGDK